MGENFSRRSNACALTRPDPRLRTVGVCVNSRTVKAKDEEFPAVFGGRSESASVSGGSLARKRPFCRTGSTLWSKHAASQTFGSLGIWHHGNCSVGHLHHSYHDGHRC